MGALGIVAGSGDLPRLIAEECAAIGRPCRVVVFDGVAVDWAGAHLVIAAVFERVGQLIADLHAADCTEVVFAGAMVRPAFDPARLDAKGRQLAAGLMAGDDATLRAIAGFFANEGFVVVGAHDLLGRLLAQSGVLTKTQPTDVDRADATRAVEIVRAIGGVDVGQAAVVAQGICLGVESIQGTDALLAFVAATGGRFRRAAKGVLYKGPKPGQDWRVDLPVIGVQTIIGAASAGLAGVAVQAGGVLVLGDAVGEADRLGLFVWGREGA